MRWQGMRESENVEDRRRMGVGGRTAVGGGLGTIVIVIIALLLGKNPLALLQGTGGLPGGGGGIPGLPGGSTQVSPQEEERAKFVRVILGSTEDVWNDLFRQMGQTYREPHLQMFTGETRSACGFANAAVGPFYCPGDEKAYIDLSFFDELDQRFKAPGEFAQAYVVAHEIGHHVQNLLGTSDKVHEMRSRLSEKEYNQLSVRLELQADFYAGVWAHHAQKMKRFLDPGDLESALRAAAAIGDDRLQKQSQGYVVPDSFTHGTSEQRVRWFRKGFETGDPRAGDTFNAAQP